MPTKAKHPLNQSRLFKIPSPERLATILGVPLDELRALCTSQSYREFDLLGKNGKVRRCEDPLPNLKKVHRKIAGFLSRIEAPDFLYCPVKGRCYVSNAAAHRNNRVVRCLDITKFFPNTPQRRVFWFFHKVMLCRRDVAGLLAELATFDGRLPTGSPLSPILAYFAFHDMWAEIEVLCHERGQIVTVYIDDVTISGEKVSTADVWAIKQIIHRFGLRYHKEKSYVDRPATVTGVIVRDGKLLAPNRQHKKRKIASELMLTAPTDSGIRNQLMGLQGQIGQIARLNGEG